MPLNIVNNHSRVVEQKVFKHGFYICPDRISIAPRQMKSRNMRTVNVKSPISSFIEEQLDYEARALEHCQSRSL